MSTLSPPPREDPLPAPPAGGPGRLPDRPLVTTPARLHGQAFRDAERKRLARQPRLGLAGLLLVIPVAVLFAFGAGGTSDSVLVLAPLLTFALPAVAMVAFWWEDWPGSRLHPGWSGLLDTVLIGVAAVGLAVVGQLVVGGLDVGGIFDPSPGPGHSALFPASLPLAGAAFVAVLQLTLVCEGWPFRRLPRFLAGTAALAFSWGVALIVYFLLVDYHAPPGSGLSDQSGPLAGSELGAVLVLIGAWQVWLFLVWRGWPFAELRHRLPRILWGNIVVVAGAVLTYYVANGPGGVSPGTINAAAGCFAAAGLIVGMLFEGVFEGRNLRRGQIRAAALAASLLLAAVLYTAFTAYADSLTWTTRPTSQEWVGHAALNALALSVILHVAIGRRWPFGDNTVSSEEKHSS